MISRKLIGGNGFIEHLGTLGDELSLVNALLVKRCEEKN